MNALHPRSNKTDRSPYFYRIFNDIANNSVLDFGGNQGNLLHFVEEIDESKYTCIDVNLSSLESGAKEFPKAKWIHYNKYNWAYHHEGNFNEPFPVVPKHDYVYAYSVFSHTSLDDFYQSLKYFISRANKKVAVSFLSTDDYPVINWFYEKRIKDYGTCIDIRDYVTSDYNSVYFMDNNIQVFNQEVYGKHDVRFFLALYNKKYLIEYLADRGIAATIDHEGDVPFLVITI